MIWIQTYSGIAWQLDRPRARDVRLEDVVHALSRIARFTGHTRTEWIYSVAHHSLLVGRRVAELCEDPAVELAGLLHDAHEAYLGDISRPLATLLPRLRELKRAHDLAVATWAGIDPELFAHPLVRQADDEALATEARDLLGPPPEAWPELPRPWRPVIQPLEIHARQPQWPLLALRVAEEAMRAARDDLACSLAESAGRARP